MSSRPSRTSKKTASPSPAIDYDELREQAKRLRLHGLLARWDEVEGEPWLQKLLMGEEEERKRRSLERRIRNARLGSFKLLADFEWAWPKHIDRELVEELFRFSFLEQASNVVLIGPNGVGKTMVAQNLAYEAVLRGHTARFVTASELLNELVAEESSTALVRRLKRVARPHLLVIDEVGYLSYDSRHADLLFEVINRRHEQRSTIITTNRVFTEWGEVFPNASSVVALVDRLLHRAEVVEIDADSYRLKEAKEREARRATERAARRAKRRPSKKKSKR